MQNFLNKEEFQELNRIFIGDCNRMPVAIAKKHLYNTLADIVKIREKNNLDKGNNDQFFKYKNFANAVAAQITGDDAAFNISINNISRNDETIVTYLHDKESGINEFGDVIIVGNTMYYFELYDGEPVIICNPLYSNGEWDNERIIDVSVRRLFKKDHKWIINQILKDFKKYGSAYEWDDQIEGE